jgi:hypothetical protein
VSVDEKLGALARSVDAALDAADQQGLQEVLCSLKELEAQVSTAQQRGLVHYFSANALAGLRQMQGEGETWWQQPLFAREFFHLRVALSEFDKSDEGEARKLQVLTNLGNAYSHAGRFVEAIATWNRALSKFAFGMALANRGIGFFEYARYVQVAPAQVLLLRDSRESLRLALKAGVEEHAEADIHSRFEHVSSLLDWAKFESPEMPLAANMATPERQYRLWCRRHGLFLSPLNDLADLTNIEDIADTLMLPDITVPLNEGAAEPPAVYGMFNQLKQEFVSARYLAYEALQESEREQLHFSDHGVTLLNMLDYRLYRLWVEKLKMAFLSAHAIFDKLAYLMNAYWKLGLEPHQVSFGGVWYVGGRRRDGVSAKVKSIKNWPLRGLFWMSRDFYDGADLPEEVAPEARMLHEIRNHIAHKYLRVHDSLIGALRPGRQELPRDFSFQVTGPELQVYTLELLKLVRSATVLLAAAMEHEERDKRLASGESLFAPMVIMPIDDELRL